MAHTYQDDRKLDIETTNEFCVTFNTSKIVLSKEHEEHYFKSLLWPQVRQTRDVNTVKLKLRHAAGSYVYLEPYNKKRRSRLWDHFYANKAVDQGFQMPLEYQCNLCSLSGLD